MMTSRLLTPFLCFWLAGLGCGVAQAQSPGSRGGYHPYVGDVNLPREGYELGWRDNYRPAPPRPQPQEQDSTAAVYRRGHQAGANDARNGLSPYPDRHENLYTTRTAKIFREGYADGYHRRRSVY